MAKSPEEQKGVSRRKLLPLLGSTFLLPFLGYSQKPQIERLEDEEAYEMLLKPDGTTVRVRKSSLKNAKVVKKKLSNTSLLNWLGMKKNN